MSKGNMLLGHARGKVGDLVFSRSNGQQVTRSRAAVVKNPQTESQMIQRIILNTVAQAYSRMRPLCDHSFEGVQEGQDSMSAFMRKNLKALRNRVAEAVANNTDLDSVSAFTPIGANIFATNAYVLSSGSLPGVAVSFPTTGNVVVAALGGATYGDIIDALNLQRGDQLTFVAIKGLTAQAATLHYSRVILDPTNADGTPAELSLPLLNGNAINVPSPRNTGDFASLSMSEGNLSFSLGNAGQVTQCAAVIVSRKEQNGGWLRSNTSFVVNEQAVVGIQESLQSCLDAFAAGGFDSASALYLNNAGTGALVRSAGVVQRMTPEQIEDSRFFTDYRATSVSATDESSSAFAGDVYWPESQFNLRISVILGAQASSVALAQATDGVSVTFPYLGSAQNATIRVDSSKKPTGQDAFVVPLVVDGYPVTLSVYSV